MDCVVAGFTFFGLMYPSVSKIKEQLQTSKVGDCEHSSNCGRAVMAVSKQQSSFCFW